MTVRTTAGLAQADSSEDHGMNTEENRNLERYASLRGKTKFRAPDMVVWEPVRFLRQDRRVRPHSAFEAGCRGTACLFY
jgi:hypothetical protein